MTSPGIAPGFRPALPGYRFRFPRDHAAHTSYQTEWWYYTGHLASGERRFGFELTLFRVGIDPRPPAGRSAWATRTLYFAHFTVTDENRNDFHFFDKVSRPALGMAGSETTHYQVWIDDWSAELLQDQVTQRLHASAEGFAISLDLVAEKPPVIHGVDGVSQKAPGLGRASHYYSLTRLRTSGTITVFGETLRVSGLTWMDHEFGSNQLTPDQDGWDWFSVQLDDRRELMLYLMRLRNGGIEPVSSGTIVYPDGTWRNLRLSDFQARATGTWRSPKTGAVYPAGWTVRVPSEGVDLRLTPTVADQELATQSAIGVKYWEGSVRIDGRDAGMPVKGVGYVELTGYAGEAPGI